MPARTWRRNQALCVIWAVLMFFPSAVISQQKPLRSRPQLVYGHLGRRCPAGTWPQLVCGHVGVRPRWHLSCAHRRAQRCACGTGEHEAFTRPLLIASCRCLIMYFHYTWAQPRPAPPSPSCWRQLGNSARLTVLPRIPCNVCSRSVLSFCFKVVCCPGT